MIFHSSLLFAVLWQTASVIADDNSCNSSVTINSQNDVNNLTNCETIEGSVTISSSASGTITLSNIEEIKGSFSVESRSSINNLVLPKLETLQGGLIIDNVDSLGHITFNSLDKASSISITGNSNLKSLMFPQLNEVDGDLKLTGSFSSVLLPSLDQVKGQTTIRGSSSMSCSALDALKSEGVFTGSYSCSSGSSNPLSAGAKAGIAIAVVVVVILILVVVWLVLRRRRQQRARKQSTPSESPPLSDVLSSDITEEKPSTQQQVIPVRELKPPLPRKPVGPQAAQLDGRSIYEASSPMSPATVYHEMDAGPVVGSHQRPIHSDA
ncbi:hypothetical protein N7450_000078 [Penicillium hetheringtonii]|uniref:Receptor L-domain domain-containing protein n=1 Tax=Penicillium hetheringtonii TaxID=911720 RepID=A0AAD6H1D6_9EURO|nr:hypothetical protein N7450_000078 [Penicillium hetheringtonii]